MSVSDTHGRGLALIAFGLVAAFFLFEFVARILPSLAIDQIAPDLELSNARFGTVSSVFFWVYAPMQLVVGALLDRYGAKRLVVPACATCATGVLLFGVADAPMLAILGRFLTGLGASFAFVSALFVVTHQFAPERFALLSGVVNMVGMIGAAIGAVLLTDLMVASGWRNAFFWTGGVGLFLAVLMFIFLPKSAATHDHVARTSLLNGFGEIFRSARLWVIALSGALYYMPINVFGGHWGQSDLIQDHGLSQVSAELAVSMVFWGMALGKCGRRRCRRLVGSAPGACCKQCRAGRDLLWLCNLFVLFVRPAPLRRALSGGCFLRRAGSHLCHGKGRHTCWASWQNHCLCEHDRHRLGCNLPAACRRNARPVRRQLQDRIVAHSGLLDRSICPDLVRYERRSHAQSQISMKWLAGLVGVACLFVLAAILFVENEILEVTTNPPVDLEQRVVPDAASASLEDIRAALLDAGLNTTPILGDTGVTEHLARFEAGAISAENLLAYAEDLNALSQRSAANGAAIPAAFWDVDTPALAKNGWTSYAIVAHVADDRGRPYFDLLSKAYARFLDYRSGSGADDTALDAAFDILDLSHTYILSLPEDRRLQHGPKLQSVEAATLMAWQTVVAGTTRRLPGLAQPVFEHGFVGRFSVKTIYQYDVQTAMSVGEVWGTSGFKDRFVGPVENNNQIEHLTISALLQVVARTPVSVLDALEREKATVGASSSGEAKADIALNNAIHRYFLPGVYDSFDTAVGKLKTVLED